MNRMSPLLRRIYRHLLTLYPSDFRKEWSSEMEETLELGEEHAAQKGAGAPLMRFWWREFRALVRTAFTLRWALTGDALGQDLRFGVRVLRRKPLFTLVAIGTLGVGIGSATSMFSVVSGVLLRPLPYERPEEIMQVWQTFPEWRSVDGLAATWDRVTLDWSDFSRWKEGQTTFGEVAIYSQRTANLTGRGDPMQLSAGQASASLLPLLGIRPALGRWFSEEEDGPGARNITVITHGFWQDQFGGDPGVLGEELTLNGEPMEVVGVLPRGFWMGPVGEGSSRDPHLWVPAGSLGQTLERGDFDFQALGRLSDPRLRERGEAEAGRLFQGEGGFGERGARLEARDSAERGSYRRPLFLLLLSSGALLLIACGNLAGLLTGEWTRRGHEVAARTALGAPGSRIFRQFLTESVLLGVAGSGVGLVIALGTTGAVLRMAPPLPGGSALSVNWVLLAMAILVGIGAGVAFGVVPALQARRTPPSRILREASSGEGRRELSFQNLVLGGQMALTVALLTTTLLLARSLESLFAVDPGFDAQELAEVQIRFPFYRYQDQEARFQAIQQIHLALASVPGVEEVSGTNSLPFSGSTINTFPEVPGRTVTPGERRPSARRRQILPDYLEALGIPVLAGRPLTGADRPGAPGAVLVNEAMVRRFWPDRSPLGETLIHSDTFTVVGVVGNVLHGSLRDEAYPTFYLPLAQSYRRRPPLDMSFIVRSGLPPATLFPQFRQAVWSVDSELPISRMSETSSLLTDSAQEERFRTTLLTLFALAATLLAGAGVFGVTARRVAGQSREMGVRMALGAERSTLVLRVVRRTALPGLAGLAFGLGGAWVTSRSLAGLLYGVEPGDPVSYLGAAFFLSLVMAAAAFVPAKRAASIMPMEVLRQD